MSKSDKYGYKIVTLNIPHELLDRIDKERQTPDGEIKRSPFIVNRLSEIFNVKKDERPNKKRRSSGN